jgi:hypothetical protein
MNKITITEAPIVIPARAKLRGSLPCSTFGQGLPSEIRSAMPTDGWYEIIIDGFDDGLSRGPERRVLYHLAGWEIMTIRGSSEIIRCTLCTRQPIAQLVSEPGGGFGVIRQSNNAAHSLPPSAALLTEAQATHFATCPVWP